MLVGVLLAVSSQEVVPLSLEVSTAGSDIAVDFVGLVGDVEGLVSGEIEYNEVISSALRAMGEVSS